MFLLFEQNAQPEEFNAQQSNSQPTHAEYQAPVFNYSQLFNHNNQDTSNSNPPLLPGTSIGNVKNPFGSSLNQNRESQEITDQLMQFVGPNSQQFPGGIRPGIPVQQGGPQGIFPSQGGPGLPVVPFQQGGPQSINQGGPRLPIIPFQQGGPLSINHGNPGFPFPPFQQGGPQSINQGGPSLPLIPNQPGGNRGLPIIQIQPGRPQTNVGLPFIQIPQVTLPEPVREVTTPGILSPIVTQPPPTVPYIPPVPLVTPQPYRPVITQPPYRPQPNNIFEQMYPQYGNQNQINSPFVNGPIRPPGIPGPNPLDSAYLVSSCNNYPFW